MLRQMKVWLRTYFRGPATYLARTVSRNKHFPLVVARDIIDQKRRERGDVRRPTKQFPWFAASSSRVGCDNI